MLVPLAPYPPPPPPAPYTPPPNGAQSQLVCSGCRNLLLYPVGATSVCCAVCNAVTTVPPPGTVQFLHRNGPVSLWRLSHFPHVHPWSHKCAMLLLSHGQSSFGSHYFVCMNIVTANLVAHVNCGNCKMLLRYQYGARSVKCAVCSFVTSVGASTSTTEQKFST
ncbi:Protein LOL1 [Glycine soja]